MLRSLFFLASFLGLFSFITSQRLLAAEEFGDFLPEENNPAEEARNNLEEAGIRTRGYQIAAERILGAGNDLRLMGDGIDVLTRLFREEEVAQKAILEYIIGKIRQIKFEDGDPIKKATSLERLYFALGKIIYFSGVTPTLEIQKQIIDFLSENFHGAIQGLSDRANFGIRFRLLLVLAQAALTWQKNVLHEGERAVTPYTHRVMLLAQKNELLRSASIWFESLPESEMSETLANLLKAVSFFTLNHVELSRKVFSPENAQDWRALETFVQLHAFLHSSGERELVTGKERKSLSQLDALSFITNHPNQSSVSLERSYYALLDEFKARAKKAYYPRMWDANWMVSFDDLMAGRPLGPSMDKQETFRPGTYSFSLDFTLLQEHYLSRAFPRVLSPSGTDIERVRQMALEPAPLRTWYRFWRR